MIDLSFLQFSRMTPRERMLRGIQGQLSPTFGLEVGAPRAQLGVIPLRGLGLWRPAPTVDATGVTVGPSILTERAPTTDASVYTAPTTTYATVAVQAPTVHEQPAYVAPVATTQDQPTAMVVVTDEGSDEPDQQVAEGDAPPSSNPPMSARDEYDPSTYASGTDDDTEVDQYTDYDSDGNKQDAWGEGGGSWGSNAQDHDTMANKGAIKQVASKTEAAIQQAKATAVQYWPWILGGGVLLGAAFLMGRRK